MIVGVDDITNPDYAMEVKASNQYLELAMHEMEHIGMAMGCQKFTADNLAHLISNLDKLRMMICQPDAGQRGQGVSWRDLEFVKSHICVEVMAAYLSGALAHIPVDNPETYTLSRSDRPNSGDVDVVAIDAHENKISD